jgi:hypothetical protein
MAMMKRPVVKLSKKVMKEVTKESTKQKAKSATKPATKPKAPAKKKIEMMPDKINPFKMTPAQKARYLKNPERYDY